MEIKNSEIIKAEYPTYDKTINLDMLPQTITGGTAPTILNNRPEKQHMFPTALLCIISLLAILYSKIKYIAEKKEKTKKISSLLITICLICGVVFLKSLDDLSIVNIVILHGLCINILLGIIAIIIFVIANENFKDDCIKILKKIKVSFLLLVPYIIWHMDNVMPAKDVSNLLGIIGVVLLIVALASLFGAAITSIFKKGKKAKVIKTFLKVAKDACVLFVVICLVYPFYSIEDVVAILRPTLELAASITLLVLFIMLVILEIVSKIKHVKIKDSEKVEKMLHITIIVLLLMGMINTYYVI